MTWILKRLKSFASAVLFNLVKQFPPFDYFEEKKYELSWIFLLLLDVKGI